MRCVRCGKCCKTYAVVVVKDPALGICEGNLLALKGDGTTPCPHLCGAEPGAYSCAIHGYPWYKETPCYAHTQVEAKNSPCRMGEYILKEAKKKC